MVTFYGLCEECTIRLELRRTNLNENAIGEHLNAMYQNMSDEAQNFTLHSIYLFILQKFLSFYAQMNMNLAFV